MGVGGGSSPVRPNRALVCAELSKCAWSGMDDIRHSSMRLDITPHADELQSDKVPGGGDSGPAAFFRREADAKVAQVIDPIPLEQLPVLVVSQGPALGGSLIGPCAGRGRSDQAEARVEEFPSAHQFIPLRSEIIPAGRPESRSGYSTFMERPQTCCAEGFPGLHLEESDAVEFTIVDFAVTYT